MKEVKIKDIQEPIYLEDRDAALILTLQELTNQIRRLCNK